MEAISPEPLRVLLIDDDPIVLDIVSLLLATRGFEVEPALGGLQGLNALKGSSALPDVVLVDHQMPEISGTAIAEHVAAITGHRPRVIAMSASPLPLAERKVFDGFLPKPIDGDALQSALAGLPSVETAEPDAFPGEEADVLDEATGQTVDQAKVLKLRAIMSPEALQDFYRVYLADTRQRIAELERYAADGDEEALRRCAHSLKGAAAMAGVPGIAALAAGFEAGYLPRRTHERVFQQLRSACDDVEQRMILNESAGEAR